MRAAVVLGLAPILALGLFLSARTVVSDKPVPATVHPSAIVWSDRVFTNQGQLAVWLQSRDASYRVWVERHPAASWFHHIFPTTPAPTEAVAPTTPASPNDSALLRLLVIGSLAVLGVALTAGALRLAGGALAARRRSTVFARAAGASLMRPAAQPVPAPAAVAPARRLRTAEVYAPPRVMPTFRTRTRTAAAPAAKVIPLYAPPDPEPESEIAELVEVPEPQPQSQPTLVAPEVEPEVAQLVEQHETLPEPRPSLVEPEASPWPPAPQTTDVPGGPPAADDPVPLPAPPEPEPEPEPELEPAAEAAVAPPSLGTAALEAREDDHVAEEPPHSAMPEPAPPGSDWQTCEIGLWQGYVKSQFYARVTGANGQDYTVGVSPLFRSKDPLAHDEIGRSAHVQLAQQLLEQGWAADGRGSVWYELRFRQFA